jgi:VanZ family protein
LKIKRHTIWPFAIALAIFLASGTKNLAAPDFGFDFSYDKLAHLLVFGLFATAILRIPYFFKQGWKGALIAIAIVSLYGALDEYHQSFSGRSVEFDDWIADTLGAALASILYLKCQWYRRLWECPSTRRATTQV